MASITIWDRIEPRCRSLDFNSGLQARVHDPLWFLGRQWQVGEFEARDGGSPVMATVQSSVAALDRFSAGGQTTQPYDRRTPIETLVERETVRPASATGDYRQAAEAGLYFLRLLTAANIPGTIAALYLGHYPLAATSGDAQTISSVVAGRVIDGIKLYADFKAAGSSLPALPAIPQDQHDAVLNVTRKWLTWYTGLFSEPGQANGWSPDRMEYSFAMAAAAGAGSYVAREYDGGSVDWHTFDSSAKPMAGATAQPLTNTKNITVAPVTFRGMPARRFWEIEDAAVNFGQLSAAAEDIGRLLLRDFALIYGNDWFQIPIAVSVGSQIDITSLSIADTFGFATTVPKYSTVDGVNGAWRVFVNSADPGDQAVASTATISQPLLVPSSAVNSIDGQPIEDVLLLRDELANLVWGIERLVYGASGQRIARATAWNTNLPVTPPPAAKASLRYRLGSNVPDYWLPFLPVPASTGSVKLQRGRLPTASTGPLGKMLAYPSMTLFLEEVPREGVHLKRRYRLARGLDGSPFLWIGRLRDIGEGEGSSGLRFDFLE